MMNCPEGKAHEEFHICVQQVSLTLLLTPPTHSSPMVPLYNGYEVLGEEGLSEGGNSLLSLDVLTKPIEEKPSTNTKTT